VRKDERVAEDGAKAEQRQSKMKEWDMRWSLQGTQQDGKEMMWTR